ESDTESTGVRLLRAIKEVFAATGATRIFTIDLLQALVERESEPWPGWWGKEVDQAVKDKRTPRSASMDLARHLRPFGIVPKTVRVAGDKDRGYDLADFADAFARYVDDLIDLSVFWSAVAEYASLARHRPEGRDNETTLAAQGFEASRPPSDQTEVETPGTLGGEGLSWRLALETLEDAPESDWGQIDPLGWGPSGTGEARPASFGGRPETALEREPGSDDDTPPTAPRRAATEDDAVD